MYFAAARQEKSYNEHRAAVLHQAIGAQKECVGIARDANALLTEDSRDNRNELKAAARLLADILQAASQISANLATFVATNGQIHAQ